ncbi:unnamed protein product [Adineta steineri]|uniref:Macro domain-containing protein n=1 Tax=Adineta steineri TaxID=433720 RepID=A0A814KWR9_9BILA|nr:unnamed protein product [Adineta steineri]CAF3723048.1 unnamed protein product [Adineta steineri]
MSGVIIDKVDDDTAVFKFANGSLKVTIRQGDLSKEACDAIVNPTNKSMTHNGGLDSIIHKTMGQYFTDQVVAIKNKFGDNACPVGQSRIFIAKFNREENIAHYVINTVGPHYRDDEREQAAFHLQSCYYTSLALANLYTLSSIAYPAISCGAFKFPANEAAKVGIESVRQYSYHVKDVRFVLFDRPVFDAFVHEWTEYSQKVNREANVIDDRDRYQSRSPPPIPRPSSVRICVLCKERTLPVDRQLFCDVCSNLTRSEVFNKFLQRLRSAADKSYDDLHKECLILKPILLSYPLVYTPAQTFDQGIHTRDTVAEHYLQSHCDRKFRNAMPVAIVGDGNCFYNTFVKLGGVGATNEASSFTPVELRGRNAVELILNKDEYTKKYKALEPILDSFEKYVVEEMVHDTTYVTVWDLLSIPTVLNINITSVYPKVNGDSDLNYQLLNGKLYEPIIHKDTTNKNQPNIPMTIVPIKVVRLLFSHCNRPTHIGSKKENWTPNHYVPLLNLR